MLIEIFENLLPFSLFVILNGDVSFLEGLVLTIVFPRDLLVLLTNHVGFCASILILKCLLVEKLLLNLC